MLAGWLKLSKLALGGLAVVAIAAATLSRPVTAFNPQPDPPFGMFGIAQGQTARLNIVNAAAPGAVATPPDPCRAQLQFLDADGNVIAHRRVEVKPGHATFLDYVANLIPTNTVGDVVAPLRAELRPVVNFTNEVPPDPCRVSVEVFDNATGRTEMIVIPPPCRGAACRVND